MNTGQDRRIFLGWDKPIVAAVVEYLVADRDAGPGRPLDLEDVLVVVPTLRAGRRLRESLAKWCDERNTAVIMARAVTPAFFLRNRSTISPDEAPTPVASGIWAKLLMDMDLDEFPDLFPAGVPDRDYSWSLHTGRTLARLRKTLADAGLRIPDVPDKAADQLEEPQRWADMGRLEEAYLSELAKAGYADPLLEEMRRAKSPELPAGVKSVVVAAVPGPTSLMLEALKSLEAMNTNMEMNVLVHADEEFMDWFDDWGQPDPAKWNKAPIDIPDFEKSVRLAADPQAQARLVGEIIAEHADEIGPNDVAIGVPDATVIPFLESHLVSRNLPAFDPSEKAIASHPLYRLLNAFCRLYTTRSYDAFSALVRHPEVLNYFEVEHELSTEQLATALDNFQNFHLPMALDDIRARFNGADYRGPDRRSPYQTLGQAIPIVLGWLDFLDGGLDGGIRNLLGAVYGARKTIGDSPKEKELEAVAGAVDRALRDCADAVSALNLTNMDAVLLFLDSLAAESVARERERAIVDLEGWLEMPWNDASLLILTGMNEGSVPDSRLGDVFVPDSLRKALDLPNDETRFARDAYLLKDMLSTRRAGRVVLVVGKVSAVGDPLKPSRLLFRCKTDKLLARTKHLFGDIEAMQKNFPFNRSFLLNPTAPIGSSVRIDHLSPSQIRTYLQCPFEYYLQKILGMEELSDDVTGLTPSEFGNAMHAVLEVLAEDEGLRACKDDRAIAAALHSRLDQWIRKRFGKQPPLTIRLAVSSARQRLTQAAKVQAEQAEQGWAILPTPEEKFDIEINGVNVTGRIDRIDFHEGTGQYRVVDYKTGKPLAPRKAHLASAKNAIALAKFTVQEKGKDKEYAWSDVQLPIYSLMVRQRMSPDLPVKVAYFNLPRAVAGTEIAEWEDLSEELIDEAQQCAGRIADAINAREFWPPTDTDRYDTFETIVTGSLSETMDADKFKESLAR